MVQELARMRAEEQAGQAGQAVQAGQAGQAGSRDVMKHGGFNRLTPQQIWDTV
jgi:hypothetical protein